MVTCCFFRAVGFLPPKLLKSYQFKTGWNLIVPHWPRKISFLIRSAADHLLISSYQPSSINFCPPEVRVFIFWSIAHERTLLTFRYITHCMSACKSFAAQFSSMLHVTTDSVRVFIFCSIAHERTLLTQAFLGISHTAMSACKSFAAQFSSMLHVTTDSLAGWKLCLLSITRGETLSPLESFNGHLLFLSGGRISSSETVKILLI